MRARAISDSAGYAARVVVTRRRAGLARVTGAVAPAAESAAGPVSEFTPVLGRFLAQTPPRLGTIRIRRSTCARKHLERVAAKKLLQVEVVAPRGVQVQILSWA